MTKYNKSSSELFSHLNNFINNIYHSIDKMSNLLSINIKVLIEIFIYFSQIKKYPDSIQMSIYKKTNRSVKISRLVDSAQCTVLFISVARFIFYYFLFLGAPKFKFRAKFAGFFSGRVNNLT